VAVMVDKVLADMEFELRYMIVVGNTALFVNMMAECTVLGVKKGLMLAGHKG
jgi:hypothetical protein